MTNRSSVNGCSKSHLQIADFHTHHIRSKHIFRIYIYTCFIKHTVTRILVYTSLCIFKRMVRSNLALGIAPVLSDTIPAFCCCLFLLIISGEIVFFNDTAHLVNIIRSSCIATVLDDLNRFLVILLAFQTSVSKCFAFLCTQQVCGMISNRCFDIRICPECSCNRYILSIYIFLRLLGIFTRSVP